MKSSTPRTFPFLLIVLLSCLSLAAMSEEAKKKKVLWKSPITGVVFSDGNDNSVYDATDIPATGLKVRLISLDAEEIEIASMRTDDKGRFDFESIYAGNYRIEVFGFLKEVVKSDPFAVVVGKAAPFFAIEIKPEPTNPFRGRIANPKNTEGNIISPFSPDPDRNLPGRETEPRKKTES